MLSDLNWKRSNVRTETKCTRCGRTLLAAQQSIQIDRARVCISCWDEVRADPTKTAQEYKREFNVAAASTSTRKSSSGGSRATTRRPTKSLEPTLSAYDASLLVGNELDRQVQDSAAQVLDARELAFADPGFDHIVVGPAGATVIGSKAYSSAVLIEALVGWASTSIPPNVMIHGRNRRDLIDLAVEQREALAKLVESAKFGFDVPVGVSLCFESVEGIDRTPVRDALGVRIETPAKVGEYAVRRGPLNEREIDQVVDMLRAAAEHPLTG
jgi:DNA-directed RNA polymerase subunit RPC12/RpoP